jgi:transposase
LARARFAAWAATHVSCSDAVVLEATANAWVLYDQLTRLSGSVTVAHPLAVKLISAARVKTDARDTIKLARSLSANLIPAVWVPPVAVREVRALVTHRKRLVKQRSQARNRLQGVLQRHNLSAKDGECLCDSWLAPGGTRSRFLKQSSCASGRILRWKIRSIP